MISYHYVCKNGHEVWIKHRSSHWDAARFVKCFEYGCDQKMRRTGKAIEKNGHGHFHKGDYK